MTNDELQAHVAAIQQEVSAGRVQQFRLGEWTTLDHPLRDLRIKPQSREVYIQEAELSHDFAQYPKAYPSIVIGPGGFAGGQKWARFREVIE